MLLSVISYEFCILGHKIVQVPADNIPRFYGTTKYCCVAQEQELLSFQYVVFKIMEMVI